MNFGSGHLDDELTSAARTDQVVDLTEEIIR